MSQIQKKFIGNAQVDDQKILIRNQQFLKARNAANSADVSILKVNASDRIEFFSVPQIPPGAGSPTVDDDIITKGYADSIYLGAADRVAAKRGVRVVAIANLDLTGAETIDGEVLVTGDRVLATAQTDPEDNGIYIVNTAGAWTRSTDLSDSNESVNGFFVWVFQGAVYEKSVWILDTIAAITLGTTPLTFTQFSPSGSFGVLPNNTNFLARNAANTTDVALFEYNEYNEFVLYKTDGTQVASMEQSSLYDDTGNISINWLNRDMYFGINQIANWNAAGVKIYGTGSVARSLDLRSGDNANKIEIKSPDALGGDVLFQLPPDNGTAGYVLTTDGAGVTTWEPGGGGGSPSVAKAGVKAVSTVNIALDETTTNVGGTPLLDGDRVLVTAQTASADNGIYVASTTTTWVRADDANSSGDFIPGFLVEVFSNNYLSKTLWTFDQQPNISFTLGSDAVLFAKLTVKPGRETVLLDGTDITNQYRDLNTLVQEDSVQLFVRGGGLMEAGTDYTLSTVAGVTRLTFAGDLATGGLAALIAGDTIQITYLI